MSKIEKPIFFSTPKKFRNWLIKNHLKESELWVGYYKKHTGIESISWPQSVDQALCFGWIDGIRKSIDERSYKIRFTPRKKDSHWSDVNIKRINELMAQEQVYSAGIAVFKKRSEKRSRRASYEQKKVILDPTFRKKLRKNDKAWSYFQSQTPSYQKQCIWWIMSAKREDTRKKRLNILIQSSENGEWIPPMKWTQKG